MVSTKFTTFALALLAGATTVTAAPVESKGHGHGRGSRHNKDFHFTKGQKFAMDLEDIEGAAPVTLEVVNSDYRLNLGPSIDGSDFAGCLVEATNVDDENDRYVFFNCDSAQEGFKRGAGDAFSLSFSGEKFKRRRGKAMRDEKFKTKGVDLALPIPEEALRLRRSLPEHAMERRQNVSCTPGVTRTIAFLMAYDQRLINDIGGGESNTQAQLYNAFAVIEDIFDNTISRGYWDCNVVPRLDGFVFVPRSSLTYTTNLLLDSFYDWHYGEMTSLRASFPDYDHILLNTPNVNYSYGGVAYVGTSCDYPDYSVGIVTPSTSFSSTSYGQAFAHEMGHNMGMQHDQYGDTTCNSGIMDYDFAYSVFYFGQCSTTESEPYIRRSCYN
eukprot:Clim_evm101s225 gene=Clim_evmTU101s225